MIWILPAVFAAMAFTQMGALSVWVTVLSFALRTVTLIAIAAVLAFAARVAWVRRRR
jgi:hypothetical protein